MLTDLPSELYYILKSYLQTDNFLCLLNCAKSVFQQVKKDHAYYSLDATSSIRFLTEEEFRSKLLSRVKNPCRQIAIEISYSDFDCAVYAANFTVHKVTWKVPGSIPPLPHISALEVWSEQSIIGECSHLKSLSIRSSKCLLEKSNFINIQDLKIEDGKELTEETLALLGKQTKLALTLCSTLHQVDNLSNIKELLLSDCPNLKDLRPLRGIRTLIIHRCNQISDISCLGGHYKLQISCCAYNLCGYDALRNIPVVHLGRGDISDLSVLRYSKRVQLWRCNELTDLLHLRNAKKLDIMDCSRITDISSLDSVEDLTVIQLPNIKTSIRSMKSNCILRSTVQNDWELKLLHQAIHTLTICGYYPVRLDYSMPYLHCLRLFNFDKDLSLIEFRSVPTVILDRCMILTSLKGLGNNRRVELRECPLITDVSCLKNVPIVKIDGCAGIKDYSCLKGLQLIK